MAVMLQPCLSLFLFFAFLYSSIPLSHCQFGSPQNLETFCPSSEAPSPAPAPAPSSPSNPPITSSPEPPLQPSPLPISPQSVPPPPSSSSRSKIVKAVAATAASTLVLSGLLLCLINRCAATKRRRENGSTALNKAPPAVVPQNESTRFDGGLRGFVLDENGLDVVYWKKLEGKNCTKSFRKEVLHNLGNEGGTEVKEDPRRKKSEPIQEVPLFRGKSSTSHVKVVPEVDDPNPISTPAGMAIIKDFKKPEPSIQPLTRPPPPRPCPHPKQSSVLDTRNRALFLQTLSIPLPPLGPRRHLLQPELVNSDHPIHSASCQ